MNPIIKHDFIVFLKVLSYVATALASYLAGNAV